MSNTVYNKCLSLGRVPTMQPTAGRLEISICKTVAEPLGFKPFSKVSLLKKDTTTASPLC